MKLLSTAALLLGMAVSGQCYAQTMASTCQFNPASPLTDIDIPRQTMKAEELPIAFESGYSDADLKFVWGEVIANHARLNFGDVADVGSGLLFTKNGPALGATTVDGKPVWRFAPQGSACEEEIVPRDILSSGPSGYDFGGAAAQGDVTYTLWRKKTTARYETILIAMMGKKGGRPTPVRIATLPVDAKALSLKAAQGGSVDLIMIAVKPRDKSSYLFALNYKPKAQ